MRGAAQALGAAFAYFSVVPAGRFSSTRVPPGAAALAALPIVGGVVGALAGGLGWVASLALPHALAAALALGAVLLLTGAIHVDGFLDGCDAFFASVAPERRLEILKDPRHGTYAVAGMFVAGSLWLAALGALAPRSYPVALAFAGALSRAAVVPQALLFAHARGGSAPDSGDARPALVAVAFTLAALLGAAFVLAPRAMWLVPGALLASWLIARFVMRRLGGGLVGDAYGFAIVLLEIGVLIGLAAGTPARFG